MNTGKPSYPAHSMQRDGVTPASIACYIFDISGELTVMAERGQMKLLAYLLSMVHAEAESLRQPACGLVTTSDPGPSGGQGET